jgi:hypothetical protein
MAGPFRHTSSQWSFWETEGVEERMTELIDKVHFQELSTRDPEDVCRRAGCRYDRATDRYTVSVWGEDVNIFPHSMTIESASGELQDRHAYLYLFAIHYLLGSQVVDISGSWISEKEVPGGATFFRGPHRIPTDMVSNRFNNDTDAFKQRCRQLGGEPIEMADAAYVFRITDRIPVAALYWQGDDDFPAECKILYDRTINAHLAPDVIYALAVGVCKRLGRSD